MTRISFPKKQRKDGSGLWFSKNSKAYLVGTYDGALQSEIEETKEKTEARSCFSACQTCGHCKSSRRSCSAPFNYDNGKTVYCEGCEKFGFCDCANGNLRNTRGEAEPFTPEHQKLLKESGGKPLI